MCRRLNLGEKGRLKVKSRLVTPSINTICSGKRYLKTCLHCHNIIQDLFLQSPFKKTAYILRFQTHELTNSHIHTRPNINTHTEAHIQICLFCCVRRRRTLFFVTQFFQLSVVSIVEHVSINFIVPDSHKCEKR